MNPKDEFIKKGYVIYPNLISSELIEKFGINGYNTVKNNFSLNEMLRKHS